MAQVNYTAAVSEIRGKLNGNSFSRNKGGAYIRTKVTPINPSTSYQSAQRAQISNISKSWSADLSDAQRQGWTNFGKLIGAKSIFGNSTILSGIATYQAINRIVLNCGQPMIFDAPISQQVPSILSLTCAADHVAGTLIATFTPTPLVGPQGLYIFGTPPMSPGISNASTQLRFIGFVVAATSPLDITSLWTARFGTFPGASGQRIAITAEVADPTTGAISSTTGTSCIVS